MLELFISVAQPHHFYAAPAPGKIFGIRIRIPYGRVQGSGYNACTGKYCIICPGGTKKKFDAAPAPAAPTLAPAPTLLNSKAKFLK
jgi:hypothetical protein